MVYSPAMRRETSRIAVLPLTGLVAALAWVGARAPADEAPATAGVEAAALPAAVDLGPRFEEWGLAVRGQGPRPTCSVVTMVVAMEFALARARGHGEPLSVEYANWAANEACGHADDGSFFHDVWAGYEAHGICPERLLPYGTRFDAGAAPPEEARAAALDLRSRFPLRLHWIAPLPERPGLTEAHLAEIKAVLAAGYPVGGGSYHSIVFVGYRDDPAEPGGGVLAIRDSGGAGGVGSISYEAAMKRFGDVLWIEAGAPWRSYPGPMGSSR